MKKIFLGPPGSGKGTAASKIAPEFNVPHISTGDLFRKNIEDQTEIGIKAKEFIDDGKLVPDEIVVEMLKERILDDDCKEGFILDGFPRTIPQAETLNEVTEVDIVINLDVPDEVIIQRLSSRVSCKKCKKIYNLISIPTKKQGVCDECEGEVVRRTDDEPETIQRRLEVYKQQTMPLIEFYKKMGILREILCENLEQTPEETFQEVMKAINEFLER